MNPFNPSTIQPSNLSMRTEPRSGTVLMEAVLCLPILLFLLTAIVQFSRLWEAKLLTKHAAYNAARAALVYNEKDYASRKNGRIEFKTQGGAVWLAAVNTLAWRSSTDASRGKDGNYVFPGFEGDPNYRIGSSAFIRDQVRIVPSQSWESNGMVRVAVRFECPLLFSIFALGTVQDRANEHQDPDARIRPLVHDPEEDFRSRSRWDWGIPHVSLVESCVLPKPWSTAWYPRVGKREERYMEMTAP